MPTTRPRHPEDIDTRDLIDGGSGAVVSGGVYEAGTGQRAARVEAGLTHPVAGLYKIEE